MLDIKILTFLKVAQFKIILGSSWVNLTQPAVSQHIKTGGILRL